MKKKILISFPMDPVHPYIHKTVSVVQWKLSRDTRYDVFPMWPCHRPFENNLHHIVNDFIKGDCEFWLSIDNDNPPLQNPLDLVELNKDIIGLPTPVWHFLDNGIEGERPIYWNGYDYDKIADGYREHQYREGLQKVDAIGTGCFLIHRRVFECDKMRKGAFMRRYLEDGTVYKGNDMEFCRKAIENGFEIYCHYGYPCDHFSSLSLNEVVKAFRNMYGDKN